MSLNPIESTNEALFELPSALIKCRVTIRKGDCKLVYEGLFSNSIDAQMDAEERFFGHGYGIDVEILK